MHPKMHLMECLHVSSCKADLYSWNYVLLAKAELNTENIFSHYISQHRCLVSDSHVETLDNRKYLIKIKPTSLRKDFIFYWHLVYDRKNDLNIYALCEFYIYMEIKLKSLPKAFIYACYFLNAWAYQPLLHATLLNTPITPPPLTRMDRNALCSSGGMKQSSPWRHTHHATHGSSQTSVVSSCFSARFQTDVFAMSTVTKAEMSFHLCGVSCTQEDTC